uniref:Reverse transcriptase domain-containing protein n=1 Tax=Solanum lycopersicum TaxID=4081 RepID=A0A3Q7JUQ6_SOLLC
MPFGLTNAPETFCNLMNNVLFYYLDDFVVVYLDDIVIYSRTLEVHVNHLNEKCEFAQQEIKFLGHLVSKNQVRMDPKKVKAIVEWQAPRHVKDLRSFLGLANYYRKFIAGSDFDRFVEERYKVGLNLNNTIASEPMLKLPDFLLPFEVHTDESDKAIGGVLVQEGHAVSFESRKLNDAEQR